MRIMVIDVGDTHVKVLASGHKRRVAFTSGQKMTPAKIVAAVRDAAAGWKDEALSIGYPGPVVHGRRLSEVNWGFAELRTEGRLDGSVIEFAFFWKEAERSESRNYSVTFSGPH